MSAVMLTCTTPHLQFFWQIILRRLQSLHWFLHFLHIYIDYFDLKLTSISNICMNNDKQYGQLSLRVYFLCNGSGE